MEAVAQRLAAMRPCHAGTWVDWAHAARRAHSFAAADEILLRAEKLHSEVGIIHFNLGCCACQMGQIEAA